jgi:hypothetical protein
MKEEQVMASALRAMRDANALRASDGAWRFDNTYCKLVIVDPFL